MTSLRIRKLLDKQYYYKAAIDFLLLAHGHRCEEFEGLCCFNLTSHGMSIHSCIHEIQSAVQKLKTEKTPKCFKNLFGHWGLRGSAASILNGIVWVIIIILTVLFTIFCIIKCFKQVFKQVFFLNKEQGVVVTPEPPSNEIILPQRVDSL